MNSRRRGQAHNRIAVVCALAVTRTAVNIYDWEHPIDIWPPCALLTSAAFVGLDPVEMSVFLLSKYLACIIAVSSLIVRD